MSINEEIRDMERRLNTLKERSFEIDMEAVSLLEQKDGLMEEFTPIQAGLANLDYKFKALSSRKDAILHEIGKATKIIIALEGEMKAEGMHI